MTARDTCLLGLCQNWAAGKFIISLGRGRVGGVVLMCWDPGQSAVPTARLIWHGQLEKLTMGLDYLRGLLYFSSA